MNINPINMSTIIKNTSGICTVFNEEGNIIKFLDSYVNQRSICEELIIVDGMSTDKTVKKIKQFINLNSEANIKIIRSNEATRKNNKSPIARGRNVAISKAKFEIIVAFDAGCAIGVSYTFEISSALIHDTNLSFVAGFYYGQDNTFTQRVYNQAILPRRNCMPENYLPSSRSFSFRKSAWRSVNGYPEIFHTGEDTLFDLNLIKSGHKYVINTDAIVFWESPKSVYQIFEKHYMYGMGKGASGIFGRKFIIKVFLMLAPVHCFKSINVYENIIRLLVFYADQIGYMSGIAWRVRNHK